MPLTAVVSNIYTQLLTLSVLQRIPKVTFSYNGASGAIITINYELRRARQLEVSLEEQLTDLSEIAIIHMALNMMFMK